MNGAPINILQAADDPNLFAPWFARGDWTAWRAFLAALFALPTTPDQAAIYREATGRAALPAKPFTEAWLICGRRSGKSFALALVGLFLAVFRDYRPYLQPGERATVMIIAADKKQARVILRYVRALLAVEMLRALVEREWAEGADLRGQVTVEVLTASFRRARGYSVAAALLDELAFWPQDQAAEPDTEIINAIRPAMATIPGAMLLCASSPYARRGALWEAFSRHWGKDTAAPLVWRAATRTMNPSVPQQVIDEANERDPAWAAAEYGATFRTDIEQFVTREAVLACTDAGVHERPPERQWRYTAFADPSGGSADSFTLAIAHREGVTPILDLVIERRPPFSPEAVVAEFADTLRRYRCPRVTGDRYAGEWVVEAFRKSGVFYAASERSKSDIFRDLLPSLNSGGVALLDHVKLHAQLVGLERRVTRGGKDSIDHGPGAHDDIANAAAGALTLAASASDRRSLSVPRIENATSYDPISHKYLPGRAITR